MSRYLYDAPWRSPTAGCSGFSGRPGVGYSAIVTDCAIGAD
jgi:hypothetical protein